MGATSISPFLNLGFAAVVHHTLPVVVLLVLFLAITVLRVKTYLFGGPLLLFQTMEERDPMTVWVSSPALGNELRLKPFLDSSHFLVLLYW